MSAWPARWDVHGLLRRQHSGRCLATPVAGHMQAVRFLQCSGVRALSGTLASNWLKDGPAVRWSSGWRESERSPWVVDEQLSELGFGDAGLDQQGPDAGEQVVITEAAVVLVAVLQPDVLAEQNLVQVALGDLGRDGAGPFG